MVTHDTLYIMLNPFPIQFLSLAAYFILRVVLGGLLVRMGIHTIHTCHTSPTLSHTYRNLLWCIGVIEIIAGSLLFIGLYTQIASLATLLTTLALFILSRRDVLFPFPPRSFLLLASASACSLLITGAGIFAFDLPL